MLKTRSNFYYGATFVVLSFLVALLFSVVLLSALLCSLIRVIFYWASSNNTVQSNSWHFLMYSQGVVNLIDHRITLCDALTVSTRITR